MKPERIAKVEKRLRRCFGSGMRLWFDVKKRRWIVQERGRRTGAWQYVFTSQGPDGSYREPGEWILARLHAADMTVVQAGARGAQKLKLMCDEPRKRRMMRKAIEEAERFGLEFMPKALRRMERDGWPVPRGKITAEQRIAHLRSQGVRGEALEAAMQAETGFAVRSASVFPVLKPSAAEAKAALKAWNTPKKRKRGASC